MVYQVIVYGWVRRCRVHRDTLASIGKIEGVFSEEDVDDGVQGVEEGVDRDLSKGKNMVNVKQKRKVQYASRVALLAKAQVGSMEYSKANFLVYQRICRDEMVKHGVRPTHIAGVLPVAVAACFIKTDSDVLAESIIESTRRKETRGLLSRVLGK